MGRIALGDRLSQAGREILYLRHSAWGVSGAIDHMHPLPPVSIGNVVAPI